MSKKKTPKTVKMPKPSKIPKPSKPPKPPKTLKLKDGSKKKGKKCKESASPTIPNLDLLEAHTKEALTKMEPPKKGKVGPLSSSRNVLRSHQGEQQGLTCFCSPLLLGGEGRPAVEHGLQRVQGSRVCLLINLSKVLPCLCQPLGQDPRQIPQSSAALWRELAQHVYTVAGVAPRRSTGLMQVVVFRQRPPCLVFQVLEPTSGLRP